MIIDISQEITNCKIYPGDPKPIIKKLNDMEKGDTYNLSSLYMCAHNGTHVDSPKHFIKDGKSIDEIPLNSFVGECYVGFHNGFITKEDAINILNKASKFNANKRILIKGNCCVTTDAAIVFSNANILLLGNESQSVGPEDAPAEVHRILLNKDIVLLEGIVLNNVEEGKYFLCAQPLNIKNIEGSPCRAILIK